jgi:predicted transcriptional regulator
MPDTLFDDQLRVRAIDPITSHAAAESIRPVLGPECARVLDVIRERTTATAYEVRAHLLSQGIDRDQNVVARRCTDLRDAGLIVETGEYRKGRTNRLLTVWTVAA